MQRAWTTVAWTFAIGLGLAGCASTPEVSVEALGAGGRAPYKGEVLVYEAGELSRDVEELARLTLETEELPPEAHKALRRKAAELGANAVIVDDTETHVRLLDGRVEEKTLYRARAAYDVAVEEEVVPGGLIVEEPDDAGGSGSGETF